MSQTSKKIKGLYVALNRLVYLHDTNILKADAEHIFIYFITVSNHSQITVALRGRRWVIRHEDGHQSVIDGQGIVGKELKLADGESFSYNSYHTSSCSCMARGSLHGVDASGEAIHVSIPQFQMTIPPDATNGRPKEIIPL